MVRELNEEFGIVPVAYTPSISTADPNAGVDDPVTYRMYVVTAWQGGPPAIRNDEHTELGRFERTAAMALPDLALEEHRPPLRELVSDRP